MSRPFRYLLVAMAWMLPLQARAEACPPTLPKDALTVRAPVGWHGYAPQAMQLTGFGLMGGEPASMTYLKPETASKTKDGGKITWRHGGEKWLACTYDGSAAIQISKRIDGDETCNATYTKNHGAIVAMDVKCSPHSARPAP